MFGGMKEHIIFGQIQYAVLY